MCANYYKNPGHRQKIPSDDELTKTGKFLHKLLNLRTWGRVSQTMERLCVACR